MLDEKTAKYYKLLQDKMKIVDEIYQNTIKQTQAIEDIDDTRLVKLLKERQRHIDNIDKLETLIKELSDKIKVNDDILFIQKDINQKFRTIYNQDTKNMEGVHRIKDTFKKDIDHIIIGKKAINKGYYKEGIQAHGYFIDHKIGK